MHEHVTIQFLYALNIIMGGSKEVWKAVMTG